jgi:hypothetical protein
MMNDKISSSVDPKLAGLNRKGRPKGAVNKTTQAAKDAIAEAFDKMGGTKALVDWADKSDDNRKVFYSQIWPKIVPLAVGGDKDNPLITEVVQRIVRS